MVSGPAHATTVNHGSGSYKVNLGRLGAFDCGGIGSTDVVASVSVLDVAGGSGPQEGSGCVLLRGLRSVRRGRHWAGDRVLTS